MGNMVAAEDREDWRPFSCDGDSDQLGRI